MDSSLENIDVCIRQSWREGTLIQLQTAITQAAQSHSTTVTITDQHHGLSDDDLDSLMDKGIEYQRTEKGYTFDFSDALI
ncbi:hypothetical protein ACVFZR_13805 [Lacticaseibacillus paracasei]